VPYNPCGRAVDWGRTGYARPCRFSKDPNFPPTQIVWYFTDQPFQDFPSAINSRIWDSEDVRDLELGEIIGSDRTGPYRKTVPGMAGNHQCGSAADFLNGVPLGYTGPIVVYDQDAIPVCCDRVPTGGGEISFAGGALTSHVNTETAPGSLSVAGGASVSALQVVDGAGELAVAGGASVSVVQVVDGAGEVGVAGGADVLLNCSSYSFNCTGTTVTVNVVTLDTLWQGTDSGGRVWSLFNRRFSTLLAPGSWILQTAPAFARFGTTAWDGRGANVFTRIGLSSGCTGNPPTLTVTGSCS